MKYVIVSGDTLSSIAKKFYGDSSRYLDIMNANPEIVDADYIQAGQQIDIPVTTAFPSPEEPTPPDQSPAPLAVAKYIPYAVAAVVVAVLFMGMQKRS
jgi:phage tail protein X